MKIKRFLLIILILCLSFVGLSCTKISFETKIENSLSEIRKNFFLGNGTNCLATFTSGLRENDYKIDGTKTSLVDFGVLVLKFKFNFGNDLPQFELSVNEDVYMDEAERNPYDGTFVFDIEKQINDNSEVKLYLVDLDEYILLEDLSSTWAVDYQKAINIFADNFKTPILNNISENVLNGEIFIKIVTDSNEIDKIYWYMLLYCSNGEIYSCLIDVNSGEIVQKQS